MAFGKKKVNTLYTPVGVPAHIIKIKFKKTGCANSYYLIKVAYTFDFDVSCINSQSDLELEEVTYAPLKKQKQIYKVRGQVTARTATMKVDNKVFLLGPTKLVSDKDIPGSVDEMFDKLYKDFGEGIKTANLQDVKAISTPVVDALNSTEEIQEDVPDTEE